MLQVSNLNVYYNESHILRNCGFECTNRADDLPNWAYGVARQRCSRHYRVAKPRSGTITLAGEPITNKSPDRRARLGTWLCSPRAGNYSPFDGEGDLLLGLEARHKGRSGKEEIPEEIFGLFPVLKTMLSRMGGDLSGGHATTTCDRACLNGKT
jgi:urea transport system ATP-binding protein